MALSTATVRDEYTGNGTTTAFAYTFKIWAAADLDAYVNGVLQTLTTHYSVSGVGAATGGTVTFVTAPPNGQKVILQSDVAATQPTSFPYSGAFNEESVEAAFDRVTRLAQQLLALGTALLTIGPNDLIRLGQDWTTATTAVNGTGEAMKANVEGYLRIELSNGTKIKIPYVKD